VGTRFSFNANTTVIARFPEAQPVYGYDGVMMPSYVDARAYILEAFFSPPLSFSALVPGWFSTHFERMKDYHRYAGAGVVIGTEPNARVKRTRLFRDLFGPVKYTATGADLGKLRQGMVQLARVYFAAGAEAVYPTSFLLDLEMKAADFKEEETITEFIRTHIRQPDDLNLNSAHPQGGNPMSDDPRIGVVDSRFRVHGYDNLFVCDASVFPTTIGINPQWTVMAMADYFSDLGVL
jgi:choline dehydrogenase-like flavoprotein